MSVQVSVRVDYGRIGHCRASRELLLCPMTGLPTEKGWAGRTRLTAASTSPRPERLLLHFT